MGLKKPFKRLKHKKVRRRGDNRYTKIQVICPFKTFFVNDLISVR